jgi:hypothetical protein
VGVTSRGARGEGIDLKSAKSCDLVLLARADENDQVKRVLMSADGTERTY